MRIDEKVIQNHMKSLGITRDEAIDLIKADAEVDKMTSMKEIQSDLTEEQKKASKQARSTGTKKTTVYKFDTSKKVRKANDGKRFLIETIKTALENAGCDGLEVTNIEREIIFHSDGVKYKVVLSAPRT